MWADFSFGDSSMISSGPTKPVAIGQKVSWDFYTRQGVHLFYNNRRTIASDEDCSVEVKVNFVPVTGELNFRFVPCWT